MQTCYDSAFTNPFTLSPPPMYGAVVPQSMSWRTKMKYFPCNRHRNPLFCMVKDAGSCRHLTCKELQDQHPGWPAWLHPLLPQEINTVFWPFSKLTAFLNYYPYLHAGFGAQWTKGWNDACVKPRGFAAAFHRITASLFVVRTNLEHCFNTWIPKSSW